MKKNMLKRLAAALLAASAAAILPLSASAAWVNNGGAWQWTENGVAVTGWRWISGDAAWYYFNASGDMQTGWLRDGDAWYYLKPSGAMARFWNEIGGKWYFMNTSGAMQYGWIMARGLWYFLGPDGAMIAGTVVQIDGETYCFDQDGVMQTGKVEIDGKTYTFNSDGQAVGTAPKADKAYRTTAGAPVEVAVTTPVSRPSYTGGSSGGTAKPDPDPDPAPTEQESAASFGVVVGDIDLLGKNASDLGSFAVSGTTVTGAAKQVTEYTGWWNDSSENNGYFIPLVIDPDVVTDEMTIATADNTFGKADLETTGAYQDSLILVYRLAKTDDAALAGSLEVTLDFGEGYTSKTYTLDFSGIYKAAADLEGDPVATVDGVAYDSLADAVQASSADDILTLLGDTETGVVSVDEAVTIDGQDNTLSPSTGDDGASSSWDNSAMLQISADATVENLKIDGTVENSTNANGIYIEGGSGSSGATEVKLTSVTIQNCEAKTTDDKNNGAGAAVRSSSLTTLTLEDCILKGNKAESSGGAISFDNTKGTLTLVNCEITDNEGGYCAGGIWIGSEANLVIQGCTITGNALSESANYCKGGCKTEQDIFINANSHGGGEATIEDSVIGVIHVEGDAQAQKGATLTLKGTCAITDVHGYSSLSTMIIEEGAEVTIGDVKYEAGTYKWNPNAEGGAKWEKQSASGNEEVTE